MMLLSCIVAHDRLELTKRTVESYLDTVTLPFHLQIYNNGSTDDTAAWISEIVISPEWERWGNIVWATNQRLNRYPGAACNDGWTNLLVSESFYGWDPATHLHRSDNDVEYQPGWCDEIASRFLEDPKLGQLGLMEERFEQGCFNVGGNSVIRRDLWDAGLRWDESVWRDNGAGSPGVNEDRLMSGEIARRGQRVARVQTECIRHLGWDFDAYPDYYARTARERGYQPEQLRAIFEEMSAR